MLKINLLVTLIFITILNLNAHDDNLSAKKESNIGNLTKVKSIGQIYLSGQPDISTIKSLKKKGFDVIINIRKESEMNFDEKSIVTQEGMQYFQIPIFTNEGISKKNIQQILKVKKQFKGKKILFHCRSGNRSGAWYALHASMHHKKNINDSIKIGNNAGMKSSLNNYITDFLTKEHNKKSERETSNR